MSTPLTKEQMINATEEIAKQVCIEEGIEYDHFIALLDRSLDQLEQGRMYEENTERTFTQEIRYQANTGLLTKKEII